MATKKTPEIEIPKTFTDSATDYLDRVKEGHERMAEAVAATRARNARITDKFVETLLAAQRDAIALTQSFAAQPTAFGKNMEAAMESLTASQERAVDLAKTLYREGTEASEALRDATQRQFESVQRYAPQLDKLTSLWGKAAA